MFATHLFHVFNCVMFFAFPLANKQINEKMKRINVALDLVTSAGLGCCIGGLIGQNVTDSGLW